ncbi:MAG: nitroreductase [Defluviitaleaceae bacterium]|nr:nitroreductase [Defluviitaleaceae bacterium]
MNEVLKAINERYSCRGFYPEALTNDQIGVLINAALAAPSAMNLQPWHIIAVTDKALIEEMDSAGMETVKKDDEWYKRILERGGKIFYDAPCIIFIASDGSEPAALDCGIVSQNIALAAHSLGLGSVICGMARIPLEGEKGEEFKRRLKFPEGSIFGMSICVGKAKVTKSPHEIDKNKVTYIK